MFDFVNRFKVVNLGIRMTKQKIITLKKITEEEFWDATKAVNKLIDDYTKSIEFLRISFDNFLENGNQGERYRAFYPEIRIEVKASPQLIVDLVLGMLQSLAFMLQPSHSLSCLKTI